MSTYTTYKATGSRWVERVPTHWTLLRAKNFLREVDDRTKTGEETLLSMRQHRGLVPHNDVSAKRIDARHLVGYKRARPDELVLNRMQAGNAMFFRAGRFGLVSPDYAVFRLLRDDNPHYLGYLFRSRPMCGLFRSESKGLGTGTSGFLRLYSDRRVLSKTRSSPTYAHRMPTSPASSTPSASSRPCSRNRSTSSLSD